MSKQKISTQKLFGETIRDLGDGVSLDEIYANRDVGQKIGDFLLKNSGVVLELKVIEGDFFCKEKFQEIFAKTVTRYKLSKWQFDGLLQGGRGCPIEAHNYLWTRMARPAESIVRSAVKQLRATEQLIGNDYKSGVLVVGVDGAPNCDFEKIVSLFAAAIADRYEDTIRGLMLFSRGRQYAFPDGGWGHLGLINCPPGNDVEAAELERVLKSLHRSIDCDWGEPSVFERIDADGFEGNFPPLKSA